MEWVIKIIILKLYPNLQREENLLYARSGYNLIKTLLSSKEGQKALSSSPGVFFMFGLTFVENKDNIFHHRKSFL